MTIAETFLQFALFTVTLRAGFETSMPLTPVSLVLEEKTFAASKCQPVN